MTSIQALFSLRARTVFWLYVVLDVILAGMGMGVPFFNILFGSVCGWYIVKRTQREHGGLADTLHRLFRYSVLTAGVTLCGMLMVWGWSMWMLADSGTSIAEFGIPMILYEPRASLIGWLLLMIVISPFLQMLMTMFAGNVTLLEGSRREFKPTNTPG